MSSLELIAQHVVDGRAAEVDRLVRESLSGGTPAEEILERGLVAGMAVVGRRFRDNEIFVPEVLVSARAMKAGLAHLEPVLSACGVPPVGTVVIGTVKGDIHDIGKNLVSVMLRGAGFRVIDLGVNVAATRFADAAMDSGAEVIAMSALLTTTMVQMPSCIEAFRAARLEAKVMVGGAPVSRDWARRIGADGYGAQATDAVTEAMRLVAEVGAARDEAAR